MVSVVRNSYVHVLNCLRMPKVLNSEAKILNILKLLYDMQGNEWFATDLQICKSTPESDPRTGTFHQMRVTAGDTACIV